MSEKEKARIEHAQQADTHRILTVPNLLSFFRILLIPVIICLYFKEQYWWAFGLLVLSGATDVVDGWIARTFHVVSDFGKAIDPVADKLTQIALLLCLMPMKYWWMVAILITKEASIGILTLIALRRTHSVYSAGWYGKICTVVIYLSMFVLILWRDADPTFVLVDAIVCSALIALAFVLYLIRYTAILRGTGKKTEGQT
jgi:cardiolipin synthase